MKVASWVKTGDHAGFPFTRLPAYVVIPMMPCLVYMRIWTLSIAILFTIIVIYMDRKGYSIMWIVNRLKGRMIGNRISARPIWYIRRFSYLDDPTRD